MRIKNLPKQVNTLLYSDIPTFLINVHSYIAEYYGTINTVYRLVHTNALKCALNQTASNWFEIICIRSIHTTETESEFDYIMYCVLAR